MLGDDKDSRIAVLSDRAEATFRVVFADENKPALEILMADFIDEKSAKAKGKRVTTLEVARIEDITPEPEPEPEPEEAAEEEAVESSLEISKSRDLEISQTTQTTQAAQPAPMDIDGVKMTFEKPKDTQLDLF